MWTGAARRRPLGYAGWVEMLEMLEMRVQVSFLGQRKAPATPASGSSRHVTGNDRRWGGFGNNQSRRRGQVEGGVTCDCAGLCLVSYYSRRDQGSGHAARMTYADACPLVHSQGPAHGDATLQQILEQLAHQRPLARYALLPLNPGRISIPKKPALLRRVDQLSSALCCCPGGSSGSDPSLCPTHSARASETRSRHSAVTYTQIPLHQPMRRTQCHKSASNISSRGYQITSYPFTCSRSVACSNVPTVSWRHGRYGSMTAVNTKTTQG